MQTIEGRRERLVVQLAMLKQRVLRKENVFTCVTFGALLLFVIAESFIVPDNLAVTAFLVAISVFLMSLLKLPADVAEDINDKLTQHLARTERCGDYEYGVLRSLRNASSNEVGALIEDASAEFEDQDWRRNELWSYRKAYFLRKRTRGIRRGLLYGYYFVIMLLLALLLLHSELMPILDQLGILSSINLSLLTLWSLVVVLFEVMMKGIVESAISAVLEGIPGIYL